MIKMFLSCSHVIYICISLIFIFLIIRILDYPDSRLSGLSIIRTIYRGPDESV